MPDAQGHGKCILSYTFTRPPKTIYILFLLGLQTVDGSEIWRFTSCRMFSNSSMSSWNPAISLGFSSFLKIQLPIKTRDQGSFGLQVVVVFCCKQSNIVVLQTIKYLDLLIFFWWDGGLLWLRLVLFLGPDVVFTILDLVWTNPIPPSDEGKPNVVG